MPLFLQTQTQHLLAENAKSLFQASFASVKEKIATNSEPLFLFFLIILRCEVN